MSTGNISRIVRTLASVAFVVIVGMIAGCDDPDVALPPLPDVQSISCEEQVVNDVEVYIDATASMAGYLNDGQYKELITNHLENAAPAESDVRFYQVSTAMPGGVRQVGSQMNAGNESFYATGNTDLVAAIDSSSASGLTVLVTDLFQSNSDINEVAKAVERRVYPDSLAMGMTYLAYSFDGIIYDIGLSGHSQRYSGTRPLYLLVLGEHCAVSNYYNKLRNRVSVPAQFAVMSPHVIAEPVGMGAVRNTLTNLREMTLAGGERRKHFEFVDPNLAASFTVPFEVTYAPHVTSPSTISLAAKCQDLAGSKCTAAQANMLEVSSNKMSTTISVDLDPMGVGPGQYAYDVTLRGDFNTPTWVEENSISYGDIANQGFDGSKTQNLAAFVDRLRQNMFEKFDPVIGKVQFLISKD